MFEYKPKVKPGVLAMTDLLQISSVKSNLIFQRQRCGFNRIETLGEVNSKKFVCCLITKCPMHCFGQDVAAFHNVKNQYHLQPSLRSTTTVIYRQPIFQL